MARYALFALREGPLTIGSFVADAQGGYSFFSQPRSYHVQSVPEQITAKPLPSTGKPAGFTGLNVGRYSFTAQLLSQNTEVGKPVTLRLAVSGAGNISKLELPKPQIQGSLRAFDPETKVERRFDQGMLTGRIQRDYLIVPSQPGQFTLPPLSFQYFDPQTGVYHDEKSPPPLTFSVTGEAGHVTAVVPRAPGDDKHPNAAVFPLLPLNCATIAFLAKRRCGFTAARVRCWHRPWLRSSSFFAGVKSRRATPVAALAPRRKSASEACARCGKNHARSMPSCNRLLGDFLHERFGISPGSSRRNRVARASSRSAPKTVQSISSSPSSTTVTSRALCAGERIVRVSPKNRAAAERANHHLVGQSMIFVLALIAAEDTRFTDAARLQLEARHQEAQRIYESIAEGGLRNADVEYNLGTSYGEEGDFGPAVLHLVRAKRLRDSADIDNNLQQVRERVLEQQKGTRETALLADIAEAFGHVPLGAIAGGSLATLALAWFVWVWRRRALPERRRSFLPRSRSSPLGSMPIATITPSGGRPRSSSNNRRRAKAPMNVSGRSSSSPPARKCVSCRKTRRGFRQWCSRAESLPSCRKAAVRKSRIGCDSEVYTHRLFVCVRRRRAA